jgi:hypothetical protein
MRLGKISIGVGLRFGRKTAPNVTILLSAKAKPSLKTGFETCWEVEPSKTKKRNNFSQSFFAARLWQIRGRAAPPAHGSIRPDFNSGAFARPRQA